MATKPSCDVYDTTKNVKQYRVVVHEVMSNGMQTGPPLFDSGTKDLCTRAYDRLIKKVRAGVSEPTPKPRKDKDEPQTGTTA